MSNFKWLVPSSLLFLYHLCEDFLLLVDTSCPRSVVVTYLELFELLVVRSYAKVLVTITSPPSEIPRLA